jgi:hypothetical protein
MRIAALRNARFGPNKFEHFPHGVRFDCALWMFERTEQRHAPINPQRLPAIQPAGDYLARFRINADDPLLPALAVRNVDVPVNQIHVRGAE